MGNVRWGKTRADRGIRLGLVKGKSHQEGKKKNEKWFTTRKGTGADT